MSTQARAFIYALLGLAVGVLLWSRLGLPADDTGRLALAVLAMGGAVAQVLPVVVGRHQAYYLTPVFLVAGAFTLPSEALALQVVLTFVPSLLRRQLSWHIWLFNFANLTVATFLARTLFWRLDGSLQLSLAEPANLLAALAATALFVCANLGFMVLTLYLARSNGAREPRLWRWESLGVGVCLGCTGILVALLWQIGPLLVGLVLATLVLIYRALNTFPLQEQARTDAKTGLYNTRYFSQILAAEYQRAVRYRRPLSVIMADLDLLRNINNTYGHLAGDVVLKGVAGIVMNGLREYDLAARFGGEEFAIILPETDSADALAVAQRLRRQVEEAAFSVGTAAEPIRATLSLGVASYPTHGELANDILDQADLAVYYAKLRGRNRVWVASPESAALRPTMRGRAGEDLAAAATPAEQFGAGQTVRDWLLEAAPMAGSSIAAKVVAASEAASGFGLPSVGVLGNALPMGGSWRSPRNLFLFLLAGSLLVLAGVLWLLYQPWELSLPPADLVGFACLVVLGESLAIDTYGRGRVHIGVLFALAGGIAGGREAALLLAPVLAVSSLLFGRDRPRLLPFHLGISTLACFSAAGIYSRLAGLLPSDSMVWLGLAAGCSALAYYAVDTCLLALTLAMANATTLLHVWNARFRWLLPYYLICGFLALFCALTYAAVGTWGLIFFAAAPALLHLAMHRFASRAVASVADLKRANQELVRAHDDALSGLENLRATYDATIVEFATAMDSRDAEARGHSRRVAEYAALIGRELGLPYEEIMGMLNGALLHDVGKMSLADSILRKPGPLSLVEWAAMRQHPEEGYRMLRHIAFLASALPIIRHHHERFDGKGYPDGLKGAAIPLSARIFAIADALDSMTTERPFRAAHTLDDAREEIARCAGGQFDPRVVEAFLLVDVRELVRVRQSHPVTVESEPESDAATASAV
ncbi:MAG: diguanylate cyclase [Chloroflexota bacterium]